MSFCNAPQRAAKNAAHAGNTAAAANASHTGNTAAQCHNSSAHATMQSSGWSSQRIALCALLCAASALSTLLLEFPIMPGITWLKYDPSSAIALICACLFDPALTLVVSTVPYLVHLTSSTGVFGCIMAICATVSLTMPVSIIYRALPARTGMIAAFGVGSIVCLAACLGANLLITPLYTGAPLNAVLAMIVPLLLPFNIIKLVINIVLAGALLAPVRRIVMHDTSYAEKTAHVAALQSTQNEQDAQGAHDAQDAQAVQGTPRL